MAKILDERQWLSFLDIARLLNHLRANEKATRTKVGRRRLRLAPTGSLQEISISSGWGDEFLEIAARFDRAVAPLRQA
jgi:hypothetical protein